MIEQATLELYTFVGEENDKGKRKKIRIEDFGIYHKNNPYPYYGLGHFIIRHQTQKMEFCDFVNKLVECIINTVPKINFKNEFYISSYSEMNTGAELYIHFSSINQVVKIAYLDTRIPDASRGNSQDYRSYDELKLSSRSVWINSFIEKGCIVYTKEYVKKNKFVDYHYFDENLIVIPYEVFFGSFFDQVEYYWRILKEAGFIFNSWEKLEEAKKIVEDIRFRLNNNMPLF